MPKEEGEKRRISAVFSRLLAEADYLTIAKVVERCRPRGKDTYIHSVGEFVSLPARLATHKERGIDAIEDVGLLRVVEEGRTSFVLSEWRSEILVMFFTADVDAAKGIVSSLIGLSPRWWKFTREGFEAPYLKQLDRSDPFLFFSQTRSSLEIIGSKKEILKCFDLTRDLI